MTAFKNALAYEAAAVFMNTEEFADEMVIDGAPRPAMWDEENAPAPDVHGASVDAWGLNAESGVLLVLENSMTLPVPQQTIIVEGQKWKVVKAKPQNGIIRIELQRNVS